LSRFGLPDWRSMLLALTALSVGFLVLLSAILMWQMRPQLHRGDPVGRAWDRFCRRLARRGLSRAPHEGPMDFSQRITSERPWLAKATRRITQLRIALRYRSLDGPTLRKRVQRRCRKFRGKEN